MDCYFYTKFWKLYPDVINALEYTSNKYNCAILANQEAYVKKLIYDCFKIDNILIASKAAFFAFPIATVATGVP